MTTILLTGFEPFDGQGVNASWAAVQEVAHGWPGILDAAGVVHQPAQSTGHQDSMLVVRRLPVSFSRAPVVLAALARQHRPDVVICVGEAGGRARVSIERVAINVQDARIPDEDGATPVDEPVVSGGPAGYFSTLPIKSALSAIRRVGVPGEVSNTAGTFVCNTIAYALGDLLSAGAAAPGARGGFVHVPRLPEQMAPGAPSLSAVESGRALSAVLDAVLTTDQDLRVAAGTET